MSERRLALPAWLRRPVYGSAAIDSTALGLYLAAVALYLVRVIHMSAGAAGLVLGIGGAASMIGAIPIARLAERHSAGRVLGWLFVIRGASFVGLGLAGDPVSASLFVSVAGFLNRGIGPIIQSAALDGSGETTRPVVLARLRSLRNAGIAVGGIPVGYVLSVNSNIGFRAMLVVAGALAAAAALLTLRLPHQGHSKAVHSHQRERFPKQFILVTIVFGLLTISAIVLGIGLPLTIAAAPRVPQWTVGFVQVLNTIMVVVLQVSFSRGSERIPRARVMMAVAGVLAMLGCALLAILPGLSGPGGVAAVVACVLVFTFSELLLSAGGMGIALSFVPAAARARYLAIFNLGFAGATIVGPPLVGLATGHVPLSWALFGGLFLVLGGVSLFLPAGAAHTEDDAPAAASAPSAQESEEEKGN